MKKLNSYTCNWGHRTVTIQEVDGTTPFMIKCRYVDRAEGSMFSEGCNQMAGSSFGRTLYKDDIPTLEWYKPDENELKKLEAKDPETYQHCKAGGLLLREYNPDGAEE